MLLHGLGGGLQHLFGFQLYFGYCLYYYFVKYLNNMTLGEASNNYVAHAPEIDEGLSTTHNRKAFIEGANWAVEKAIKWITENVERYIWYDETELLYGDDCGLNDLFFDDFRESMKE